MTFSDLPHILVVDDDERIRTLIARYLWKHEFVAMCAADTAEAKIILKDFIVDLIVCDVMMPGQDGFEFVKELRAKSNHMPVILLTALGEVENRIQGFEMGADDYLPKPFDPKELTLRIQALLKRVPKKTRVKEVHIGPYIFDADHQQLSGGDGSSISLTELETKLLGALAGLPNEVITREGLADMCEMSGTDRAIDVQITRLRKKIEVDAANPKFIKTVRGKGYMLRMDVV